MFIRVILSGTFTLVLENEIDYEYEFSNQFACLRKLIITSSSSLFFFFFVHVIVSYRKELLFRRYDFLQIFSSYPYHVSFSQQSIKVAIIILSSVVVCIK